MNAKEALRISIDMGDFVSGAYLSDLTDVELLHRPCKGCNHINWQLGHLITSGNFHLSNVSPDAPIPLPQGFAEKYRAETATVDDPKRLCSKSELMDLRHKLRAAVLDSLEKIPDTELDRQTGIEYAPTVAALFELQGSHWLMHAGQWTVIRRQLGRKPLF